MQPKIVLTHWVHPEVVEILSPHGELILNATRETLVPGELSRRIADADAVMAFMPDSVDQDFLDAAPRLKIIAGALKGYDNFDVRACTQRSVWLTNVPDLLTIPTAELAITLMLALSRNVLPGDRWIRSGQFEGWRPVLYGQGITGRTIGILGMGAVGRVIARRLSGFDAEVLYFDRQPIEKADEYTLNVQFAQLDSLLAASDYLIIALPLNDSTYHLIDDDRLGRIKHGAYIINVGRGSVVDESAVARELEQGTIAGFAADVFEMEDWALPDRPGSIAQPLIDAPDRTLFTPHLGSAVEDVRRDITMEAARNIIDLLEGRVPRGAVNRI